MQSAGAFADLMMLQMAGDGDPGLEELAGAVGVPVAAGLVKGMASPGTAPRGSDPARRTSPRAEEKPPDPTALMLVQPAVVMPPLPAPPREAVKANEAANPGVVSSDVPMATVPQPLATAALSQPPDRPEAAIPAPVVPPNPVGFPVPPQVEAALPKVSGVPAPGLAAIPRRRLADTSSRDIDTPPAPLSGAEAPLQQPVEPVVIQPRGGLGGTGLQVAKPGPIGDVEPDGGGWGPAPPSPHAAVPPAGEPPASFAQWIPPQSDPGPSVRAPSQPSQPPQPSAPAMMTASGETVPVRVARAVRNGQDTISIELHPAELGRVEVRVAFHPGGGVDLQMVVSRQETYQALVHDRTALEQQFAQAGIDLGSGGLDLRFGQHSHRPDQPLPGIASADPVGGSEPVAVRSSVIAGDGLLDIVA